MKEAYFATAQNLKDESFPVVMAAVDAAQNVDLSKREKVGGYPTCKSSHDWFNSIFQRLFHHFRLIEWFIRGIVYFFASFKLGLFFTQICSLCGELEISKRILYVSPFFFFDK